MSEENQDSTNNPDSRKTTPAQAVKVPAAQDHAAILRTISAPRFKAYLIHTGHNRETALRLYMWNAQIGEAFHVPIQSLEVALRNRVNFALQSQFGKNWWDTEELLELADQERKDDLELAKKRIRNRKQTLETDQIVAGLSFGFWAGLLLPRYNPPLWSGQLRRAFPNLPETRSRKSLAKNVGRILYLRNRIWHHEPIFKRDLSQDYQVVMTTLEWICPATWAWIRPHCRVPALLREKP